MAGRKRAFYFIAGGVQSKVDSLHTKSNHQLFQLIEPLF